MDTEVDLFVICLSDEAEEEMRFLFEGARFFVAYSTSRKISRGFGQADTALAETVMIVGDKDLAAGVVEIKDQVTRRTYNVPLDQQVIEATLRYCIITQFPHRGLRNG